MARRGTFAFDLSRPLKKGTLLKQGGIHKAFKHRFFVLYPGFLVYYDDATKWKLDMTRGETLGSRLGAVKLRNGSVSIARSAPKGCKFGLIVHAPDPTNKRITYLLNATSKPERDEWIEAIKQATPASKNSPNPVRKDVKAKPDPKRKEEKELQPPHPTYTQRQTTADEVALQASQEETESDKVTSIDEQVTPSITIRHDTANTAALIDSSESSQLVEEKEEQVTSIDQILGPKLNEDASSEEESSRSSSVTNDVKKEENSQEDIVGEENGQVDIVGEEEKRDQEELNGEEEEDKGGEPVQLVDTVRSSLNSNETSEEVTTSVTVAVTIEAVSNGAENKEQAESTDNGGKVANGTHSNGGNEELEAQNGSESIKSSEVSFRQEENQNLFSVTVTGMEDSTSSDDEDDSPGSPGSEEGRSSPPTPLISVDRVPTLEGNKKQEKPADLEVKNGTSEGTSSDLSTSVLSTNSNGTRRRSSTPFIEKTGYLYKMGGHRASWKLRYFILRPGVFTYYKKKSPNAKPLSEVKLKNLQIFFPGLNERKQSFQFTVHTESSWNKRSDWVLAGQSEREMKDWISAFKVAGMKVSPPGSDEDTELPTSNGAVSRP